MIPARLRSRNFWLAFGALAAIVVVAVLLRFVDLANNPGGLYPDEAAEGLDAARLLHQPGFHPDFMVWYQGDGGREALFSYFVAVAFRFFGDTAVVLRATSAAFGVASVLAIGWLGRRFGTWVGLTAAAWAAGALWLVNINRTGMRNSIVPFFGALALVALMHWATRPSRRTAVLAGAVTSLAAMYTYQPLKLLPVLAVVWLLWLRRYDRARYDELRPGFAWFVAAFLIIAAPMLAIVVTNPDNYFGRIAYTSALNTNSNADANPLIHAIRTVLMFGLTGDPNGRANVASWPLLPLPLTVVAGFGLVRLWRMRRDASHSLILLALPVFLLPPILATEGGSPHFLRTLGMAAPLGVTIGLGALEIVEQVRRRWGRSREWPAAAAAAAVAVTLTAVAVWTGWAYFSNPPADRYRDFSGDIYALSQMASPPGSAVVTDGFSAMDVLFVDYADAPAVIAPGSTISNPTAYTRILSLNRNDLAKAVGPEWAARIVPIAWNPSGKPAVWEVVP
ncbi:MAG TPA: glycosyltransferase 87 family protein [Candidatus Limnocylindrales bacterium]